MVNITDHPPVASPQAVGQAKSLVKADKTKILLVENDIPLAMMMVHVLSQAGSDVTVANTGKKGIELASENKFDLVVLAADLPDVSGYSIVRELKQRHLSRQTPIVFVASQSSEEDRRHSLELGALDYITKPFEARDFLSRILAHIETEAIEPVDRFPKVH
jgi:DNA-binding response OmpR family regulator